MTERKISAYPKFTFQPKSGDLFLSVRDTSGIPTTGTFNYAGLFANVSVPAYFSNTVVAQSVTAETLRLSIPYTPQTSLASLPPGSIRVDEDYIYVGVGTKLKRVRLEDF